MAKIFYVVGASGAGKDSLMQLARKQVEGRSVAFAHRYITRPADDNTENFISLSQAEFARRLASGCFWWHWYSHDLSYGLGIEVLAWLEAGLTIVVNGSRAYLQEARRLAQQAGLELVVVWVYCDPRVLAERLRLRGRENAEQISERLHRAQAFVAPEDALVIDNSGSLQQAWVQWQPHLIAALHD